MPVTVTRGTGVSALAYSIVPSPLVSINKQIFNNPGRPGFGADYSISLQGTLIPTHGNPIFGSGMSSFAGTGTEWTQTSQIEEQEIVHVDSESLASATIAKQELIRWLFTGPSISGVQQPIKVSINGWGGASEALEFYGYAEDISFDSDSRWALPTTYTVNLKAAAFTKSAANTFTPGTDLAEHSGIKYAISSLTDNFDIQEDGRFIASFTPVDAKSTRTVKNLTKVFSVSRSITAVGMPVYDTNGGYKDGLQPWQQASGYIYAYVRPQDTGLTPSGNYNPPGFKEAGLSFQETIDKEGGTYTLTKNYTLYSGEHPVVETMTIDRQVGENYANTITVNGTIQGLNTASGVTVTGNAYLNALAYYTGIIETGVNTSPPQAYYFARGIIGTGVNWLHPKPLSKSAASDFSAGTISYSYTFDDRPPNIIQGSVSESIQVSDTYPGEIFSVTPVIGRSQPILQYLNSRSEYKRSLSINVTMGTPTGYHWNTTIGGSHVNGLGEHNISSVFNTIQGLYLHQKPSIEHISEFRQIYDAVNPTRDPYFTVPAGKCFHSAPTESWDARTRTYSYSIEWTYERL